MSKLPTIAILGRPNVGKSTLLNRMVGSRVSIVEPTAGVTRDRISVPARLDTEWGPRWVQVIDTGGIGIVDRDDLGGHVEEQVRAALLAADVVLFLVDSRDGVAPLDMQVAERLRGSKLPVLLVANKAEGPKQEWEIAAFHSLGMSDGPYPISAQNGDGISELYKRISEVLPALERGEERVYPALKLAVVGRRNAGKSTLINSLAREERVIVSEVPGTTRDAVDVLIERDGVTYTVIDTAGVRRKKNFADAIDFYSDVRSHKAVRRADVVLLLFDAMERMSSLEKKLARYVTDHYKPVILVANKWDTVENFDLEELEKYVAAQLPGLSWAPLCAISAKTGFRVGKLMDLAQEIHAQAARRIGTGELNRVLRSALEARTPSSKSYGVKIYYATQADTTPPTFVIFVKNKKLIGKDYIRYLENRMRKEFDFTEVPLRFVLREHNKSDLDEMGVEL